MSLTNKKLADEFRAIRATLTKKGRDHWETKQAELQKSVKPTPEEWVLHLRQFVDKTRLTIALQNWQNNRLHHVDGWGEDINPSSHIKNWSDTLTPSEKALLLECQYIEDLEVQASYEEWRDDRDW